MESYFFGFVTYSHLATILSVCAAGLIGMLAIIFVMMLVYGKGDSQDIKDRV